MYQDFRYNLKQGIADTNMDILAIHNEKEDMLDEITKRNNPTPKDGETIIKIDQLIKHQYIKISSKELNLTRKKKNFIAVEDLDLIFIQPTLGIKVNEDSYL